MCCTRLNANAGPKSRQKSPSGHHPTTLSGYIFATKACIDNMVNLGPLAAEIVSLVWGTPGNFNGFRVLAALLHGTPVVGVSQTAALKRGRHLYSAGRPSGWALAHISSFIKFHNANVTTQQTELGTGDQRQTYKYGGPVLHKLWALLVTSM